MTLFLGPHQGCLSFVEPTAHAVGMGVCVTTCIPIVSERVQYLRPHAMHEVVLWIMECNSLTANKMCHVCR